MHTLLGCWVFSGLFPTHGISITRILPTIGIILSFFLLLCISINAYRGWWPQFKVIKYDWVIIICLIGWNLLQCIGHFPAGFIKFLTFWGNTQIGALPWFLPILIFIGLDIRAMNALENIAFIHLFIGLFIVLGSIWSIVVIKAPATIPTMLLVGPSTYGASFLVLSRSRVGWKRGFILIMLFLLAIFHYLAGNRLKMIIAVFFILAGIFFFNEGGLRNKAKQLIVITIFSVLILIILFIGYVNSNGSQWFVDTRSFLVIEMAQDFTLHDWILGRGPLGSYFSRYFLETMQHGRGGDDAIRQVNEIGVLHIILKMGGVGLLLYLGAIGIAIRNAWKRINTRVGIASFFTLAAYLSGLFIGGDIEFSPGQVFIWVLIGHLLADHPNSNVDGGLRIIFGEKESCPRLAEGQP